jgi:hypothetical protein
VDDLFNGAIGTFLRDSASGISNIVGGVPSSDTAVRLEIADCRMCSLGVMRRSCTLESKNVGERSGLLKDVRLPIVEFCAPPTPAPTGPEEGSSGSPLVSRIASISGFFGLESSLCSAIAVLRRCVLINHAPANSSRRKTTAPTVAPTMVGTETEFAFDTRELEGEFDGADVLDGVEVVSLLVAEYPK